MIGINLTCQSCFKPCFFDCIKARNDVSALLDLLRVESLMPSLTAAQKNQFVSTFKSIFGSHTLFGFSCVACRSKIVGSGHFNAENIELKRKINSMETEAKKTNSDFTDKLSKEKSNADELSYHLQQANTAIQQKDEMIRQLSEEVATLKISNTNSQAELNQSMADRESLTAALNDLQTKLNAMSASHMDTDGPSSSDAHNQCIEFMSNKFASIVSTFSEQILCHVTAECNKVAYMVNSANAHQGGNDNLAQSVAGQSTSSAQIEELQPPDEVISNKNQKGIFEIHVSKFRNSTTSEQIVNHVLSRTPIDSPELFSVELLIGAKDIVERKSYISFKISTCSAKVYEAIMNEEVWAPNFIARDYSKSNDYVARGKNNESWSKHMSTATPSHHQHRRQSDRSALKALGRNQSLKVSFNGAHHNLAANHLPATPRSSSVVRKSSVRRPQTPLNNVSFAPNKTPNYKTPNYATSHSQYFVPIQSYPSQSTFFRPMSPPMLNQHNHHNQQHLNQPFYHQFNQLNQQQYQRGPLQRQQGQQQQQLHQHQ